MTPTSSRAILTVVIAGVITAGCAQNRTKPQATTPRPTVAAALPPVCADMSFPVYFANASQDLTPAARGVITDAAARLKGCVLGRTEIIGLADATGTSAANLALSRRRGQAVARALTAAGLPAPAANVQAFGQTGATTPAGDPEPLRRRVEVVVRASPPSAVPAKESGPDRAR